MKKTILAAVLIAAAVLTACVKKEPIAIDPTPTAEASETAAAPSLTVPPTEEPSPTPEVTEAAPEDSYLGALSDDEKLAVMEYAADWYEEYFRDYEVLSMQFAEDDDIGYSDYPQYGPGEIIILLVETTHGGQGVYRRFFVTISETGFNKINEGY
ncbi:MAG: hypothetical protein K6G56_01635 [Clostridiales bacterium]|nr:hypothetical protein [Clostridiales bacterium]